MKKESIRKTVYLSMLTALSVVLMLLVRFSIIPAYSFLEYDMGDVPVLIAGLLFGPLSGLGVLFTESLIQAVTVSAASGWIGFVMHFIASGIFVLTASLIYKLCGKTKGLLTGLIAGGILMTLIMIPLNLIFTVHFLGTPREAVIDMLLPAVIPFNLIKAGLNAAVTGFLYYPLQNILKKLHYMPENAQKKKR